MRPEHFVERVRSRQEGRSVITAEPSIASSNEEYSMSCCGHFQSNRKTNEHLQSAPVEQPVSWNFPPAPRRRPLLHATSKFIVAIDFGTTFTGVAWGYFLGSSSLQYPAREADHAQFWGRRRGQKRREISTLRCPETILHNILIVYMAKIIPLHRDIPASVFKMVKGSNGNKYYKVTYELELTFGLELLFKLVNNAKVVASVTANYH